MIDDIRVLTDEYWKWLRRKTEIREIDDSVEITTPYLDRHNDYLQLYVKRQNGGFLLTDGGYIITDLEMSGCKVDSARREKLLRTTLAGFGIQYNDGALEVRASKKNFSMRKHNLIQAMLAVNDLFYTVRPPVAVNLFNEDVKNWLEISDIRYTARMKFSGTSGYDHFFDFVIPKSRKAENERLIRAINHPDRNAVQAMIFSWQDTQKARQDDSPSKMYAFLNDLASSEDKVKPLHKPVSSNVISALKNDGIIPVPWSEKGRVLEQLVA